MYYPIQNPHLFDASFDHAVQYTEYVIPTLNPYICCVWKMYAHAQEDKEYVNTILPDACIDLIIDFDANIIGLAATGKATETQEPISTIDCLGVRCKPGVIYALFDVPAYQYVDEFVQLDAISANDILYNILAIASDQERFDFLIEYLQEKMQQIQEMSWITAIDTIFDNTIEERFVEYKQNLHYSDKTIERLFLKHYGYTPLAMINILRLHKSLQILLESKDTLGNISQTLGFYDQAHFAKEIKKYCGITAKEFINSYM